MKKVVSFCLYGANATYIIGMKENIKLAKQYFSDWEVRIYHNNTVPEKYIKEYKELEAVCILCENVGDNKLNWEGMFWRWFPLDDPSVDIWLSRDADSRLSAREAKIVDEWVKSDKTLHSIRDHRCHFGYMMGGLFGINNKFFYDRYKFKAVKEIIKELSGYYKERPYNVDQIFLNDNLWKLLKDDMMAHISKDGRRVYPTDILIPSVPDFIGKQYRLNDFPENIIKHLDKSKGCYWKVSIKPTVYWSNSSTDIKCDVEFKDDGEYYIHRLEYGFPQNWTNIHVLDGIDIHVLDGIYIEKPKEVDNLSENIIKHLDKNNGCYWKRETSSTVYWSNSSTDIKCDVEFKSVGEYYTHRVEHGFPQNWDNIHVLEGIGQKIKSTTVGGIGRLGNIIFRNIMLSIIAKKHNLLIDYDHYNEISNIGINLFIGENSYLETKEINENNYFEIYNYNTLNYNVRTGRGKGSYFQQPNFIKLIFEHLTSNENMNKFINNNLYKNRYKNNNDCFIHIRLGDLEKWNPGFNYFDSILSNLDVSNIYIATDNNNHNIINRLKQKYSNIKLMDNDLKNIIQFGSTNKYVILTQGTFSAMIGYLSFYSTVYCIKYSINNIWTAKSGIDLQTGMYTQIDKWIEIDPNKTFKIKALKMNKYLDYDTNNNIVMVNDASNTENQLWKFDEYNRIINISNNKYLDFDIFFRLKLTDSKETSWLHSANGLLIDNLNNQAIEIRLNNNNNLWVNKPNDLDHQKWKLLLNNTFEEIHFNSTNNNIQTDITLNISNYYNEYNNNLDYLKYRIGDAVRLPGYLREKPKYCFMNEYYKNKKNSENFSKSNIDYKTLYNIVINSKYKECPENSMIFNLRLFEWFSWHMAEVVSITDYEKFIEDNKCILEKMDNIFLLYGTCMKKNINETQDFLNKFINILKKYNNNIYLLNSNNCDQDFKYAITAEYYVPSVGGFSGLSGALNKNNVYWEISNKYINTYKDKKDRDDLNEFIKYQSEYKNESKYLILQYDNRDLNDNYKDLLKINNKYCKKHKYEYVFVNKNYDLPPWWIKVFIVNEYLESNKYKGILWLDTDACIFNNKIELDNYNIFSEEKSFFMAGDRKGWGTSLFNAGVFFVLNNETGKNIMKDWVNSYDKNLWFKDSKNMYKTDGKWAVSDAYEQGSFCNNILSKYEKDIYKFDWTFLQSSFKDLSKDNNDNIFTFHFVYPLRPDIPEYLKYEKNFKLNKTLKELIDNSCTNKNRIHSYLEVYEILFKSKRTTATNVLEIGIGYATELNGGGTKLWRDYFTNAKIYTIDIIDIKDVYREIKDDKRIILHTSTDAYDKNIIEKKFIDKERSFDIIIDDGPHTIQSQKDFIKLYLPLLKNDGIMIIEDIACLAYIEMLKNIVPNEFKKYIEVYDLRKIKHRYDDILFIINKSATQNISDNLKSFKLNEEEFKKYINNGCYWKQSNSPHIYWANSSKNMKPDIKFNSIEEYNLHRKEHGYPQNWSDINICNDISTYKEDKEVVVDKSKEKNLTVYLLKVNCFVDYLLKDLMGGFERMGFNIISDIDDINIIRDNGIIFFDNTITNDTIENLYLKFPNSLYFGWCCHVKKNIFNLYKFKLIYITCHTLTPINEQRKLIHSMKNYCPLYHRVNEDPEKVGLYKKQIKHTWCYYGTKYRDDLIPEKIEGANMGNPSPPKNFLNYDERKDLLLSSLIHLAYQGDSNIRDGHVSQRVFEGLCYGCIVLSNSEPACIQTNNIVEYVDSLEEVEEKINYYLDNPEEVLKKQKLAYKFIKNSGTNYYSIEKLNEKTKEIYNINFLDKVNKHNINKKDKRPSISEYFDQIYIIHLNELDDRKKSIIDQIKKFNLKNITIIDAINKNKINIEELKTKELIAYGGNNYCKTHIINDRGDKCWCGGKGHNDVCNYLGRVACAFSHSLVYKDIVSNNYKRCIILEDDFVFKDNLNELFEELYKDIPNNWELIYFSNSRRYQPRDHTNYNDSFALLKSGLCEACCYGITCDVAKKLCNNFLPLRAAADGYLSVAINKLFLINKAYVFKKDLSINGTLNHIFKTSNDNVQINSEIDDNATKLNDDLKDIVNCYNKIDYKDFLENIDKIKVELIEEDDKENIKFCISDRPLVSIAISTFESSGKGHELLKHNFDQIYKQDYDNIEIIISDHSSDNKIKELCEEYDGKKYPIKYIHNPEHKGNSSQNTNNAIAHCNGEYIKILFMDDYLYNESAISIIMKQFKENPEKKWLVHSYKHTKDYKDFYNLHHPKFSHDMVFCNRIGTPSCLSIHKSVKERFDENLKWFMDSELYKRIVDNYGQPLFFHTNENIKPLMINLHHDGQVSNTSIDNNLINKEKEYITNKTHDKTLMGIS